MAEGGLSSSDKAFIKAELKWYTDDLKAYIREQVGNIISKIK